jgi:hypothetical protein
LTERFSTRALRPGSSSRAGGTTTTPRGRTDPWATGRQRLKRLSRIRRAGGPATLTSATANICPRPFSGG